MMQFSVIIPDKCKTGETVRIHLEDGTEVNFHVRLVLILFCFFID